MGQNNQNQNQGQRNQQGGQQQPGRNVNPQSDTQREQGRNSESEVQRGKFGDRKQDM